MMDQRRRPWANVKSTLVQRVMFAVWVDGFGDATQTGCYYEKIYINCDNY